MRTRNLFSLALMALSASCLLGDGRGQPQQPQTQPPTDNTKPVLHSKSGDVTLAVTVRDKKGALVPNLQKGDFSLTEDGRPQTIAAVDRLGNAPFRVGLLVETNHAMSGAMEAERKAAQKFVDGLLPAQSAEGKSADANSQGFLIHFDRQVELLEDFTDSREKLDRELDDMAPSKQAQNDTQQGPETTGEDRSDRQHGNRNGNQLYDAIFLASDEVMGPKQGHKALILFSDGVDRGSKDRMNEALDAAEKAHVEIYTVYFKGEQEKQSMDYPDHGRRGGGYPGGGGGYPGGGGGYPGGGYPSGGGRRGGDRGPSDTGVDGRKIMQQIAERTGGHAYDAHKKEDLEPIYNLIAEDLRSQYLITYTPDKPDTEGGFHKIALKANKDEYSVTAPEGYYAPGGENSH